MYERFSDRARKVMQLANQEAQRYNHEYIGTEHILLGLLKEQHGTAANVLKIMNVPVTVLRMGTQALLKSGPDMVKMGKLPQTPRAKKAIEYAMQEARLLNAGHVGTEHILLGLIREGEGIAATVLKANGLTLEKCRQEVAQLTGCQLGVAVPEPPAAWIIGVAVDGDLATSDDALTAAMGPENFAMYARTGRVHDARPLVAFLYELLRDWVQPADMENVLRSSAMAQTYFCNGHLAKYAQDLAERLLPPSPAPEPKPDKLQQELQDAKTLLANLEAQLQHCIQRINTLTGRIT